MTTICGTFPQFPELPFELRIKIWKLAIPPRLHEIPNQSFAARLKIWEDELDRGILDAPRPVPVDRLPSMMTANREAYMAIRPLYNKLFDLGGLRDPTRFCSSLVYSDAIYFNPELDVLSLSFPYAWLMLEMLRTVRTDFEKIRFVALHEDEALFSSWFNWFGAIDPGLPANFATSAAGLASMGMLPREHGAFVANRVEPAIHELLRACEKLEKLYWVMEPDGFTIRSELQQSIISGKESKASLDFEHALHFRPEKRESIVQAQKIWEKKSITCSTLELKIDRGMLDPPPPPPEKVVEDYTEADLNREVRTMRGMVGRRCISCLTEFSTGALRRTYTHDERGMTTGICFEKENVYSLWDSTQNFMESTQLVEYHARDCTSVLEKRPLRGHLRQPEIRVSLLLRENRPPFHQVLLAYCPKSS